MVPLRTVLVPLFIFPLRAALARSATPDGLEAEALAGDDECQAVGDGQCALSALQRRVGAVRRQEEQRHGKDLRLVRETGVTTSAPDPTTATETTTAAPLNKYEQCGGNGYTGPMVCAPGLACVANDEWYAQCDDPVDAPLGDDDPNATTVTTTTTPKTAQNKFEQCGGKGYTGLTKCAPGLVCIPKGEYYSLCADAIDVPFNNSAKMKEPSDAPLYTFYVYRAFANQSYEAENVNVGTLPGVIWYLHNEVVISTPRKYGIVQIKRYKIQTKAPKPLFDIGMNFGVRYAFDFGQCTGPWYCGQMFQQYGYFVGCNNLGNFPFPTFKVYYDDAIWYSLPAGCPLKTFNYHDQQCLEAQPGGRCEGTPTGTGTCTWSLEEAGEIMIDDLEGIDDYDDWVQDETHREYDPLADKGTGLSFWNDVNNTAANAARVKKAAEMFDEKYPDDPKVEHLPPPACDFDFDKFYGHPNPMEE